VSIPNFLRSVGRETLNRLGKFSPRERPLVTNPVESLEVEENEQHKLGTKARVPIALAESLSLQFVSSLPAYKAFAASQQAVYRARWELELELAKGGTGFSTSGYCYVCDDAASFYTDFLYSSAVVNGKPVPNWRERVVCETCQNSNRIRACVHLIEKVLAIRSDANIYLAEQITPLYRELKRRFPALIGSEYLGNKVALGSIDERRIRNESITKLTFQDNAFDCVLHFDVLEHVPDVAPALVEIFRTLSPGGVTLFSVPFVMGEQQTQRRAFIDEAGHVVHLMEPQYHGDPIADAGCLCFQDFGWDLLDQMRAIGFVDVEILLYWSAHFGYYGVEQMMIVGRKPDGAAE
jgi:SAM-dependent methyltransferase